ncbi:EAL domain-containing protein [Listeria valentina]|uniref:EAL domain-containing protein n=1 Tax=Listeria valentina TaxID=2705293 RepID=UPI0014321FCF|nr:EAL domain-containing protein [Listeria valentina]
MFKNYRLLAQPVYDVKHEKIVMHELVIGKVEGNKGTFIKNDDQMHAFFEENYSAFTNWLQKELMKVLANHIYPKVSINIRSSQFFHLETMKMFEKLKPYSGQIVIEITEDLVRLPETKTHFTPTELDAFLYGKIWSLQAFGYDVMLDDVGCGINSLERVTYYLPLITGFKISLEKFELTILEAFITAWKKFADEHGKLVVLEHVRSKAVSSMLEGMSLVLQQGNWLDKVVKQKVS